MQIHRDQIHAAQSGGRAALRRDLAIHLMEQRPRLFDIHPTPYLMALIDDSIDLAEGFGLTDVQAMRVFLQLRWDVAPGFHLQPRLAEGLRRHARLGMGCWEQLSRPEWGDAWLDAHDFDQPEHWRERLWGQPLP